MGYKISYKILQHRITHIAAIFYCLFICNQQRIEKAINIGEENKEGIEFQKTEQIGAKKEFGVQMQDLDDETVARAPQKSQMKKNSQRWKRKSTKATPTRAIKKCSLEDLGNQQVHYFLPMLFLTTAKILKFFTSL